MHILLRYVYCIYFVFYSLGCRMGAVSQLVVPGGTYTQVPRLSKGKHCNSVCYCSKQGMIENCVAMPCLNKGHCSVLGREIRKLFFKLFYPSFRLQKSLNYLFFCYMNLIIFMHM